MKARSTNAPRLDPVSGEWVWLGTLSEYAAARPTKANAPTCSASAARNKGDRDWWGSPFDTAADVRAAMGGKGWPEGVAWARQALPGVTLPESLNAHRRVLRGDWGDSADPDRVLRGEVETCWSRTVRTVRNAARPVVLVVPHGALGHVKDSAYRWRAVAPLLLWESLTEAGWNVGVWTVNRGEHVGRYARMAFAVEVCALGEPLGADVAMCALGLAGAFRACGFALRGSGELALGGNSGLGATIHGPAPADWWAGVPAVLREHVEGLGARVVVLENARDAEGAERATLDTLRALGVLREALT